jgi:hypothetical protein
MVGIPRTELEERAETANFGWRGANNAMGMRLSHPSDPSTVNRLESLGRHLGRNLVEAHRIKIPAIDANVE